MISSIKTQYFLVIIWIIGFLFCLSILVFNIDYIPDYSEEVLNQIIDTFAPQLTIMLTFIFSDQFNQTTDKQGDKNIFLLAIFLSTIYIILFSWFMLQFHLDLNNINSEKLIKLFGDFRPKVSFLVTAAISYYFATRK